MKFGFGLIVEIEGNMLIVYFETSGDKKVIDSFVERA